MQGAIVNGYQLRYLLGEGGMAEVWYAENSIGMPAAVKILFEKLTRNDRIVERFHNEALVMQKLNHPNIRKVYDYGYLGDRHCIIMEYLEGNDLETLMRNGRRFTDEELRQWWNQITDALNFTHAQGIVHRDIKPSNLFLDKDDNIKLLDFGIAKIMEDASLTHTGTIIGTTLYMSPEQIKTPKAVSYKTDAYSLAVSFVHLLSGKQPYDTNKLSNYEIQHSIITAPLDLSEVPNTWHYFLLPYLNKDANQRPALRHFEVLPQTVTTGNSKGKSGLWIALGMAAAVVVTLIVVLVLPKKDTPNIEPMTQPIESPTTPAYQKNPTVAPPVTKQEPPEKTEELPKEEEKQYYVTKNGIPDLGIYYGKPLPNISSLRDNFICKLEKDVPSACMNVSWLTLEMNNKECVTCEEIEDYYNNRVIDAIEITSSSFYTNYGKPGDKVSDLMNKGNFNIYIDFSGDANLVHDGISYVVDKRYIDGEVEFDETQWDNIESDWLVEVLSGTGKVTNIKFKTGAVIKSILIGEYCFDI